MVDLAPALLAAILAAQVVQVGFEAKLLATQSRMQAKVRAMWDGGEINE